MYGVPHISTHMLTIPVYIPIYIPNTNTHITTIPMYLHTNILTTYQYPHTHHTNVPSHQYIYIQYTNTHISTIPIYVTNYQYYIPVYPHTNINTICHMHIPTIPMYHTNIIYQCTHIPMYPKCWYPNQIYTHCTSYQYTNTPIYKPYTYTYHIPIYHTHKTVDNFFLNKMTLFESKWLYDTQILLELDWQVMDMFKNCKFTSIF